MMKYSLFNFFHQFTIRVILSLKVFDGIGDKMLQLIISTRKRQISIL